MNVGDTMCTLGDIQYIRTNTISTLGGDIMSTFGDVQHIRGILSDVFNTPDVLMIFPQCTEHLPMY